MQKHQPQLSHWRHISYENKEKKALWLKFVSYVLALLMISLYGTVRTSELSKSTILLLRKINIYRFKRQQQQIMFHCYLTARGML